MRSHVDGPVRLPPGPPSFEAFLSPELQPVPILPVLGLLLAVAYVTGVVRLRRRGMPWPWWQTVVFLLGCLVLVVTTGAALEGYGFEMFSAFMFQQLTLMMAVPPLLVLGRPGTMLLRATPHGPAGSVVLRAALAGLRSRAGRLLVHPVATVPLFLLAYYGVYLGPLGDALLTTWVGHTSLEVAFLAAGVLFTVPILSRDPVPRRHSHGLQVAETFLEMATHAFFGVIVIMASTPLVAAFTHPPAEWGVNVMGDQAVAGALAWSYGELPAVLMVLVVVHRWFRSETRATRAADARIDRDGNPDLEAYNAWSRTLDHGPR